MEFLWLLSFLRAVCISDVLNTGCWLHVNLASISYLVVPVFYVVFTLVNHLLGNPAVLHLLIHETLFMWCIIDSSV